MKPEYLYAIVDYYGQCWRIVDRTTKKANLPELLSQGWRPVRETPFPPVPGTSFILICLEREASGQQELGFGQ